MAGEGVLVPVETKSADNTKAKSLHQFCGRYSPKLAIKSCRTVSHVEYVSYNPCFGIF